MSPSDKIAQADALLRSYSADLQQSLEAERGRKRGSITEALWHIRKRLGEAEGFFSQSGQDWFVDRLLGHKTDGVFVDVGGYDGFTGSNTLFFELFQNWSGVLIEPNEVAFKKAAATRRCMCVNDVAAGAVQEVEFIDITEGYLQMSGRADTYAAPVLARVRENPSHQETRRTVETRALVDILAQADITDIDYLSIDVEGAELDILSSFPFDEVPVQVLSAENSTGSTEINALMTSHGFKLVEFLGADEIYVAPQLFGAF